MVSVITCDGQQFPIDEHVLTGCLTLKNFVDDIGPGESIPLPCVHSNEMGDVIFFYNVRRSLEIHLCTGSAPDMSMLGNYSGFTATNDRDIKVMRNSDVKRLSLTPITRIVPIMRAADYLCAESLLNACAMCIADAIRGKSAQEIREILGIENDFTPEEEAAIQQENAWAVIQHDNVCN